MTTSEFYGPNSISVVADKGPSGTRGNLFFLSQGEPNLNLSGDFIDGDIAIDIDTSSPTYLFIYRYETRSSITAWYLNLLESSPSSLIRLIPNSASRNQDATFVAGQTAITAQFPLPATFDSGSDLASSIDIQYSIVNDVDVSTDIQNPISSFFAITNSSIVNNVASIDLAFSAVELSQGFWVPLQGQKTIHLVITVV